MKIKQLTASRMLIIPDADIVEQSGLMIIGRTEPQQGVVYMVGPGTIDKLGNIKPMSVRVGDHVLFGRGAGEELEIENEAGETVRMLLLGEENIVVGKSVSCATPEELEND